MVQVMLSVTHVNRVFTGKQTYRVCQISMSDLMMNIHTCVTANTTYTMLYASSICQISGLMYTHVLLIALLTP
jgi:hypothetical protein